MHKKRSISLVSTQFYHFHFHPLAGLNGYPHLISCHMMNQVKLVILMKLGILVNLAILAILMNPVILVNLVGNVKFGGHHK